MQENEATHTCCYSYIVVIFVKLFVYLSYHFQISRKQVTNSPPPPPTLEEDENSSGLQ